MQAKCLLQKCAYSMLSYQELSAQQVSSYLLEHGDHYTSHSYKCLYWMTFERSIDRDLPSPECYPDRGQHNQIDVQDRLDSEMNSDDCSSELSDTESSEQETDHVTDNSNQIGIASQMLDEYMIGADIEGNVVACANQVDNYHYRPRELESLTLWDFCAQIDKIHKRRHVVYRADDVMSDSSDGEPNNGVVAGRSFGTALNILEDESQRQPTFAFLEGHVECNTCHIQVRHPQQRVVPTLVGPGLPCCDHMDTMARHVRVMLLLFKPWRQAHNLWNDCSSWSEAYNVWLSDADGMYPEKQHLINNIQSIQECKDAHDHHRAQHSCHVIPVSRNDVPGELCINDEQENLLPMDIDYEETDGGCLHFLSALEDCCSHLCIV